MNKREFKDNVYSELAKVTKSMANPHRLEIIELLAQGEFPVEQIAEQTNLTIANTSQHLQVLKVAQLVDINRQGNFIFYRLSNSNVFKAWKALRELGVERISAINSSMVTDSKSNFDFLNSFTTFSIAAIRSTPNSRNAFHALNTLWFDKR